MCKCVLYWNKFWLIILYNGLCKGGRKPVPLQRVMILEVSQYLENYLWPNFDPEASSFEHVMSMILMVNEKVCCCSTTALIWVSWCFWLSVRVCSEMGSYFFSLLGGYIVKILLAALLIRIINIFFYDRVPGQLVPTLPISTGIPPTNTSTG